MHKLQYLVAESDKLSGFKFIQLKKPLINLRHVLLKDVIGGVPRFHLYVAINRIKCGLTL